MTGDWQRDPSGRHELRYHDGTGWTDHVADGRGQQGIDPYDRGPVPDSTTAVTMQPTSHVVLWEGESQSLAAAATQGRLVTRRYRLTEDALHFEVGLVSTRAEMVPLWAVMDVDLRQSVTQRARGVGELVVRLDPSGARFGQSRVILESIPEPRMVRELLARQANTMRQRMLSHQQRLEVERRQAGATSVNVGQATPSIAPTPTPSLAEQLRQLAELRDSGILTEEEFAVQKAKLLG